MGFRRYGRSAFRKGKRVYRYARKNPQVVSAMAQSAYRMAKQMQGIINSEKHFHDTENVLTAGNGIFRLINLQHGNDHGERTGNSILLKSIYLRGQVEINPLVLNNTRFQIVIIRDNQQQADTTPALSHIFEDSNDPESMLNITHMGRFTIVWSSRTRYLTPASGGKPIFILNKYIKLNKHVRFNGPNVTDVQKGCYYMCILTSESTNYPSVNIRSRISYYDN